MEAMTIIEAVLAAVSAAPKVETLAVSAKEFITQMFKAGLINKATQDATFAFMESVRALSEAGITPPSWKVVPD